jgi:hypothetical protein
MRMSDGAIVQVTPDEIIYRASGFGSCMRALVAARRGYEASRPPKKLQEAYSRGHALEAAILQRMRDKGWISVPNSTQAEIKLHVGTLDSGQKLVLVGHVDDIMLPPSAKTFHHPLLTVDAKAFKQSYWDDFFGLGIKAFPHYAWQQSVYSEGYGASRFVLAIYNQDTGEQRELILPQVYDYDEIQVRLYQIEDLATSEVPIANIPCTDRYGCPYFFLHDPKTVVTIPDDVLTLVQNYLAAKSKEESWRKIKEVLRDQILPKLPYDEDTRTFTGSGLKVTVKSNQRHLNMQKIRELFTDAEVDIDDFYNPGEGYHIVVSEVKESGRKQE